MFQIVLIILRHASLYLLSWHVTSLLVVMRSKRRHSARQANLADQNAWQLFSLFKHIPNSTELVENFSLKWVEFKAIWHHRGALHLLLLATAAMAPSWTATAAGWFRAAPCLWFLNSLYLRNSKLRCVVNAPSLKIIQRVGPYEVFPLHIPHLNMLILIML